MSPRPMTASELLESLEALQRSAGRGGSYKTRLWELARNSSVPWPTPELRHRAAHLANRPQAASNRHVLADLVHTVRLALEEAGRLGYGNAPPEVVPIPCTDCGTKHAIGGACPAEEAGR